MGAGAAAGGVPDGGVAKASATPCVTATAGVTDGAAPADTGLAGRLGAGIVPDGAVATAAPGAVKVAAPDGVSADGAASGPPGTTGMDAAASTGDAATSGAGGGTWLAPPTLMEIAVAGAGATVTGGVIPLTAALSAESGRGAAGLASWAACVWAVPTLLVDGDDLPWTGHDARAPAMPLAPAARPEGAPADGPVAPVARAAAGVGVSDTGAAGKSAAWPKPTG